MKNSILLILLCITFFSCIPSQPKNNYIIDIELIPSLNEQKISIDNKEAIKERLLKSAVDVKVEILSSTTARIELATNSTQNHITSLLTQGGDLEFYEVMPLNTISPAITYLYESKLEKDTILLKEITEKFMVANPNSGSIGSSRIQDTATINRIFKNPLQENIPNTIFKWELPIPNSDRLNLYALKIDKDGNPAMRGNFIKDAKQQFSHFGDPSVGIEMNDLGARLWERLTERAAQDNFPIAIVVDGQVFSAPFARQAIKGGSTEISGYFTVESARVLAQVLSSSTIPKFKVQNISLKSIKE